MLSEGQSYLLNKLIETGKKITGEANAQAIPENRAFDKGIWFDNLSIEDAKKILEEEYYWQKEENRNRYPGFKWF